VKLALVQLFARNLLTTTWGQARLDRPTAGASWRYSTKLEE